jgi:pSer/pThr/pTyr-binding forkhead associated (FHA) protein
VSEEDNLPPPTAPLGFGLTKQLDENALAVIPQGLPAKVRLLLSEGRATYVLPTDTAIVIGRNSSAGEVTIDLSPFNAVELGISRKHIRIEAFGDRLMVKDLESVNGTWLNRDQLTPIQVYELRHGDELKVGRLKVRVFFLYE